MKARILIGLVVVLAVAATAAVVWADKPTQFDSKGNEIGWEQAAGTDACTRIQDGTLLASNGDVIVLGYDEFGYNYQAHMFNGRYCDYDRVIGGDSCDVDLMMKWNDAWLANVDCDGDGLLDRHYGFDSYIGSGAWLTNHMRGTGQGADDWTYFVKIVAAPADATLDGGIWYEANGTEIGPAIWGAFAIIQEVESGIGATYVSPAGPGLGNR